MVDFKKIDRMNKLAKALKGSGLAKSMDEAAKMAEDMITEEDETIAEMQKKEAEEEEEGETKEKIHKGESKSKLKKEEFEKTEEEEE